MFPRLRAVGDFPKRPKRRPMEILRVKERLSPASSRFPRGDDLVTSASESQLPRSSVDVAAGGRCARRAARYRGQRYRSPSRTGFLRAGSSSSVDAHDDDGSRGTTRGNRAFRFSPVNRQQVVRPRAYSARGFSAARRRRTRRRAPSGGTADRRFLHGGRREAGRDAADVCCADVGD